MVRQDCERYREREIWLIPEDTLTKYRANGDRLSIALPIWFEKVQMAAYSGQQGRNSRPVKAIIGGQQAA